MAEGFIVVRRGWRDNPIFKGEFSRGEAWLWLIENACWKPSRTRVKGETITLDRGEMSFSVRFLADAWGWSKSRVDRFLADLREESMIETRSKIGTPRDQKSGHIAGQGQSIIYICNYRKYQDLSANDRDNDRDNSGTTAGQRRTKEPRNQRRRTRCARENRFARGESHRSRQSVFRRGDRIPRRQAPRPDRPMVPRFRNPPLRHRAQTG